MKTTLAIPNYNGAKNLGALIRRVLEEDFAAVYVLDDCSTDNSLETLSQFGNKIKVIKGVNNLGAGGNRNRIIDHVKNGLIMFLDADMELQTQGVAAICSRAFEDETVGLIGGLIHNKAGERMDWNFGPEMHPTKDAEANLIYELAMRYSDDQEVLDYLRELAPEYSPSWKVFNIEPTEHEVDWVAEGNFCVRTDVFAKIGGYDEKMRHHETHDLGRRMREAGYAVKFSPQIAAKHLEIDVRGEARHQGFVDAQRYFYQKHWNMSRQVFDKLFGIDSQRKDEGLKDRKLSG